MTDIPDDIINIHIDEDEIVPATTVESITSLYSAKWKEMFSGITEMTRSFSSVISQYNFNGIAETLLEFSKVYTERISNFLRVNTEMFSGIQEALKNITNYISESLKNIHIPQVSEEKKQELLYAYSEWGKYGWAVIPFAELSFYNEAPESLKDANKRVLSLCTNENLKGMFNDTLNLPNVKKSDFNEAVDDFFDKKYKSCALILFALIDAKLIRMQSRANGDKRRPVGNRAVKKIKEKVESGDAHKGLFAALYCANLLTALSTVFADGNDFKEQPAVINRNFLDHGMMHCNVRRMDCVKLFLLYYDLMEMSNTKMI